MTKGKLRSIATLLSSQVETGTLVTTPNEATFIGTIVEKI
jgi:hypothetical protein